MTTNGELGVRFGARWLARGALLLICCLATPGVSALLLVAADTAVQAKSGGGSSGHSSSGHSSSAHGTGSTSSAGVHGPPWKQQREQERRRPPNPCAGDRP
jgi:hypothetical protein